MSFSEKKGTVSIPFPTYPEKMPNSYIKQGASFQRGHCPPSAEKALQCCDAGVLALLGVLACTASLQSTVCSPAVKI